MGCGVVWCGVPWRGVVVILCNSQYTMDSYLNGTTAVWLTHCSRAGSSPASM